jgi:hypothetical protein
MQTQLQLCFQAVWCGRTQWNIKLPASVVTQRHNKSYITLSLQLTGTEWYLLKHQDSTAVTRLSVHKAVTPRAQRHCVNGQVVPACQRNILPSSWRVKGQVGQEKRQMTAILLGPLGPADGKDDPSGHWEPVTQPHSVISQKTQTCSTWAIHISICNMIAGS